MSQPFNPYQTPATSAELPLDDDGEPTPVFRSAAVLALWTNLFLALVAIGHGLVFVATVVIWQVSLPTDDGWTSDNDYFSSLERIIWFGRLQASASIAASAVGAIAGLMFLFWVYRVYANLPSLGAHSLSMRPGWAVATYFVPVFNLFVPYKSMKEIWRHSDPRKEVHEDNRGDEIVLWWWSGWVASLALSWLGSLVAGIATFVTAPSVVQQLLTEGLAVATTLLAIRIVAVVTSNQRQRAASLEAVEA